MNPNQQPLPGQTPTNVVPPQDSLNQQIPQNQQPPQYAQPTPGPAAAPYPSSAPSPATTPQPQPYTTAPQLSQAQPNPYQNQPQQPTAAPGYGYPQQPAQPQQPMQQNSMPGYPQQQSGYAGYPAQPKAKKSKKVVFIIVAILVVAIAAVGGITLLSKKSPSGGNPVSSVTNKVTGGGDIIDRKDGTLDVSNLIDTQTTIKNQDLKGALNQQVNMADGFSFMVTKVEHNWTSTSKYLVAGAGKELIKVSVVIGNRDKNGQSYASDSSFKVMNAAGGLLSSKTVLPSDNVTDALQATSVEPGKQVSGAVIFEITKGEKVSLARSEKYKDYTSNAEVTVNAEVALP